MKELYTVDLPTKLYVDVSKIRFTNDNKLLFVNLKQNYESYRSVGVVNIETAKLTYFDFDGENKTGPVCFDYGILDDTRFVLVCGSASKNQQAPSSYQLRLYNMTNFKLLDTYSVSAEATNL